MVALQNSEFIWKWIKIYHTINYHGIINKSIANKEKVEETELGLKDAIGPES